MQNYKTYLEIKTGDINAWAKDSTSNVHRTNKQSCLYSRKFVLPLAKMTHPHCFIW